MWEETYTMHRKFKLLALILLLVLLMTGCTQIDSEGTVDPNAEPTVKPVPRSRHLMKAPSAISMHLLHWKRRAASPLTDRRIPLRRCWPAQRKA